LVLLNRDREGAATNVARNDRDTLLVAGRGVMSRRRPRP
jgi:hypothetical protein